MSRYILKRLAMLIPVILITSLLIFWAMSLTEGDPALILAGDKASPEKVEEIREELGLNDPFIVQYGRYMKGMVTGNMGKSYITKKRRFQNLHAKAAEYFGVGWCRGSHRYYRVYSARHLYSHSPKYFQRYGRHGLRPVRNFNAELLARIDADHHFRIKLKNIAERRQIRSCESYFACDNRRFWLGRADYPHDKVVNAGCVAARLHGDRSS